MSADQLVALAQAHQWEALEDAWIEAVTSPDPPIPSMLEAAAVVGQRDRRKAASLLAMLGTELADRGRLQDATRVLETAAPLAPNHPELRDLALLLAARLVPDGRLCQRLQEFSGLATQPLPEAWGRFQKLSGLLPGAYVLHESWGPGRVREVEPSTGELVVDFSSKKGHRMTWGMAMKALQPLPPDHLLAMTVDRMELLRRMDPVDLLAYAVRSGGGELELKDLRRLVEPVVGEEAWPQWWSQVREAAKRDSRIHFTMSKPPRVRWLVQGRADPLEELRTLPADEVVRAAGRLARDPAHREGLRQVVREKLASMKKPSDVLEALLFLQQLGDEEAGVRAAELVASAVDPVGLVLAVRSTDLRRRAMALCRGRVPSAPRELFLRSQNPSDWEALVGMMDEEEKVALAREVQRGLPQRASAFSWLVRKAEDGFPLPGTPLEWLTRLVRLLDEVPSLVGQVTSYVAEGRLQRAVGDSPQRAQALLALLDEARLPVSLKDEIRAEIFARFPHLLPAERVVWTTQEGLRRREEELRHLVKVELPANKAALAEAKAHGDLRENFEYKAAKEQQERILARIHEIQVELSKARVLDPGSVDTSRVGPGCRVQLRALDGRSRWLVILGPWDSDPGSGVFSYLAPVVAPLLGRREGDTVEMAWEDLPGPLVVERIEPWVPATGQREPT